MPFRKNKKQEEARDAEAFESELPPENEQPEEALEGEVIAPGSPEPDWDGLDTGPIVMDTDGEDDPDPEDAKTALAKKGFRLLVVAGLRGGSFAHEMTTGYPLNSLDLRQYGDLTAAGLDQLFERLNGLPATRKYLVWMAKIGDADKQWGDVVELVKMVAGTLIMERALIRDDIEAKRAANDNAAANSADGDTAA
ncbi:hypothetical protein GCM10007972_04790 [Iodidimonas muriae]|uniref:Tail assembly chaperone n=2 Tax=Iodidimonas muriae TaxID=261467 RepID=A0ABQ2L862_9PROT|nr:hypothetical protein JCM17843_25040 [Kordiimonadales bacterium JCM 17843]GGO06420.1 hypothetical protein GCM10007972_04790 [Iodidimonas muriae]